MNTKQRLSLIMGLALMASVAAIAEGQNESGGFDMSWNTLDGGGGSCIGGDFAMSGTVGQPDAGEMAGGDFVLRGGFWPGRDSTTPCPGDCAAGGDGFVDTADLLALLGQWGSTGTCDLDGNDVIDTGDLLALIGAWGACE